jgi:hypothetical protein
MPLVLVVLMVLVVSHVVTPFPALASAFGRTVGVVFFVEVLSVSVTLVVASVASMIVV